MTSRLSDACGNCVYRLCIEPLGSMSSLTYSPMSTNTLYSFKFRSVGFMCVNYFDAERTRCSTSIGSSYP